MIRGGYTTPVTEEGLSDEEYAEVVPMRGSVNPNIFGKRKFVDDKEALERLESLDLDSDEEDVLIIEAGEEDALLDGEDGPSSSLPHIKAKRSTQNESSSAGGEGKPRQMEGVGNDCPMQWLRTVGIQPSGAIQCTVSPSNALETLSDAGKTESVMADTIRAMIDVYHKKRTAVVDSKGIVATPLHVVKKLASEHTEMLHFEVLSFPSGYHRLELFSGNVRGIGEGSSKRIAAQMAAIDLLERVQLSGGTVKVPSYGFIPGMLTSNSVFRDLIALCKSKDLPNPKITSKLNLNENGKVDHMRPPHRAECWVGAELVTFGESETDVFARREAAREMYNTLADADYKDTPYAIGKSCRRTFELAAAGYRQVMSDYKKKWLLQNRVTNRQLDIPEDEAGLEEIEDIEELEKDLDNIEELGYAVGKQQKIKVTVRNKKMKIDDETPLDSSHTSRSVSVENLDKELDSWY